MDHHPPASKCQRIFAVIAATQAAHATIFHGTTADRSEHFRAAPTALPLIASNPRKTKKTKKRAHNPMHPEISPLSPILLPRRAAPPRRLRIIRKAR